MGCAFRELVHYDVFLFKVASPLVVVAMLWMPPAWLFLRNRHSREAQQTAARFSLMFLELVLPMVSTAIAQVWFISTVLFMIRPISHCGAVAQIYVCDFFDDGSYYLRADLTLPCDTSAQRRTWVAIAFVALVTYPIGVPSLFYGLLTRHRHDIRSLGNMLQLEDARSGIITLACDIAKTTQPRAAHDASVSARSVAKLKRRASFMDQFTSLSYLVHQFEIFSPSRWYAGVCLLVLRLLQTTLMTTIPTQLVQAAVACLLALGAVSTQREFSPYRRPSDNHVAVLVHWLVFEWAFVMLLRIAGLFQRRLPAIGAGVWLVFTTLGVFMRAAVLANRDRRAEERAKYSSNEETLQQQPPESSPDDSTMPQDDEIVDVEMWR